MAGTSMLTRVRGATTHDAAPGGRPRRRRTLQQRRRLLGMALVAPAMLVITVFFFVPLVLMLWMSLNDWPILGSHRFIGLDNYTRAFKDAEWRHAVLFTVKYTVLITPVLFFAGLGLALLVRRGGRPARAFQSLFFLPVVIGFASGAYLFLYLAQPGLGPLTDLATHVGLGTHESNWFSTATSALLVVTGFVTWKVTGLQMLLLMSGLQSIPGELEEAARIDGASRWQAFRLVVLPLLRPTLALVLVFSVAGSLLAFDQFYIMTSGGPSNGTITAVYEIYRQSFINFSLGYGAALSALLMLVLAAVSAVQMLLLRGSDHS
ncbi:multiple sugar transport system permease protein [Motilibacter peucedani]|uniref:Multiple sugar transport system permease protein n=1 Tax=Motilibacter peucedani TaxID=598650 RepID=A0A420XNY3_9ACTN|nr:sugar ABC transporter permease [Motilibacter peucedani]RKS73898.1 multiple sugar transport system permease protein [Motilibacter peucedani]